MKTIGVLGAGWLGTALAKKLVSQNYIVKLTSTTPKKVAQFNELGFHAFLIELLENTIIGNIEAFLEDIEILVIAIPPKVKESSLELKIKTLLNTLNKINEIKIIFISSTSVFEDQNPFAIYSEDSITNAKTPNGQALINTEQLLKYQSNHPCTILRFGGLIGQDRHPLKYLSMKSSNMNPDAPINLIHQKDCIDLIVAIITQNAFGYVFHGVHPNHQKRAIYYQQKAIENGLNSPIFDKDTIQKGKTILSVKTAKFLNYTYQSDI